MTGPPLHAVGRSPRVGRADPSQWPGSHLPDGRAGRGRYATVGWRRVSRVRARDPHRSGEAGSTHQPSAGRALSGRPDRARFRRLVPAARRHRAQCSDHRPPGQRRTSGAVRGVPRRAGDGRGSTRGPRADRRTARLLPRQDRRAAQAQRSPRRAVRREGAAAARRPGDASRRRPQDGERRARQRLRHPRHHRRHPRRPALPPLRLDRGDRPGQGRARHRRAVPQEATG